MTDQEKVERAETLAARAAIEAFTIAFAEALQSMGVSKPLTLLDGTTHVHHSLVMEDNDQAVVRMIVTFSKDQALIETVVSNVPKTGTS